MDPVFFLLSRDELSELLEEAATRAVEKYAQIKKTVYLSREEVALRLDVDKSTLYRWDQCGFLKAIKVRRRCLYSEDDVVRVEGCIKTKQQ